MLCPFLSKHRREGPPLGLQDAINVSLSKQKLALQYLVMSYFSHGTFLKGTVLNSPLTSSVSMKFLAVPSICCHPNALIIFNPFSFNTFSYHPKTSSPYFLSSSFCFYLHAFQPLLDFSLVFFCFSLPPHYWVSEKSAIRYSFFMMWECVHFFLYLAYEWSCALVAFPALVCGWIDKVNCSSWEWLTMTTAKETNSTTGFSRFC